MDIEEMQKLQEKLKTGINNFIVTGNSFTLVKLSMDLIKELDNKLRDTECLTQSE